MTTDLRYRPLLFCALAIAAAVAACGGEKESAAPPTPAVSAAPTGPITPCATCKVITVKLNTTDEGNFFEPRNFEAHEGDVIRFTLVTGVHNIHFLPDSNGGRTDLPPMTDLLQLPGQTKDILMSFGPGRYYFQCEPHAALGMVGHVKVEKREH